MELMSNFKGYGVIIEYADSDTDFSEGDEFDTIDDFVEKLKYTSKVAELDFVGIKSDDNRNDYVALFRDRNIGYGVRIYFKLILGYKKDIAKAIEDMV